MRVLLVNPSFLDYRIPVYQRLYELFDKDFYIIYAHNRVPERVVQKITRIMGDHAICFEGEKRLVFGDTNSRMSNKWFSIPLTHGLYKAIKSVKADLVISEGFFQWTPQALKYSLFHKVPLVIEYERTAWTERECPKWRTFYRQMIDKFVSGYLCNGKLTCDYLEQIGVDKKKLYVGGMSADSEGLVRAVASLSKDDIIKINNSSSLSENTNKGIVFLFCGQLIKRKGLNYLLEAWKNHIQIFQNDRIIIVGDGDQRETLEKMCVSTPSVIFTGSVDYDNIYKYYAVSDVFIIPTLEDNWCLVVPEAMSVGMPIACSKYNGGAVDLVKEGENGTVFDPLSLQSTIDALVFFHGKDLESMGKRSVELEKPWNAENCAKRIYDVLSKNFS